MQRVGFDRIDFAARPPAQQQQQGDAEQQSAEHRHKDGADRIDPGLARQAFAGQQVEQKDVHHIDGTTHQSHQHAGDAADQGCDDDQAGLARPNKGAQPARRHEVGFRTGHGGGLWA